jgi:NADH:ubiquinone oxidoreductase subunit 6 (subunit J)
MIFYRYLAEGLFFLFIAATVFGAFASLRARYLMNAVLGLALALFGVAGLFYHLGSPFLALMQLLIGIGAVCVILAFGIMVGPRPEQEAEKLGAVQRNRPLAAAACLAVSILLLLTIVGTKWTPATARIGDFSVKYLGENLLSHYCLSFELISVVLLSAILGAIVVARIGREEESE